MENGKMRREQKRKNPQSHYPKELLINMSVYIFQIHLYISKPVSNCTDILKQYLAICILKFVF